MHKQLVEEFKEFEMVAKPFAESFLKENIDLIEQKSGFNRKNFDYYKLIKVYVMYEYLRHKQNQGKAINELGLLNVFKVTNNKEYISVLKDYSNKCGKISSPTFSSFDLVCKMAKYTKKELEETNKVFSSENIIVLHGAEF